MVEQTPLDKDNQLLYAFLNRKKTRDNYSAMTAQRLVNLFRQLPAFNPEFVAQYNKMLLETDDETQMMMQDIVGGPTVRQYLNYLKQATGGQLSAENTPAEKQTIPQNIGYLPSADEDLPFVPLPSGFDKTALKSETDADMTAQDLANWKKAQEELIQQTITAQNKAISQLAETIHTAQAAVVSEDVSNPSSSSKTMQNTEKDMVPDTLVSEKQIFDTEISNSLTASADAIEPGREFEESIKAAPVFETPPEQIDTETFSDFTAPDGSLPNFEIPAEIFEESIKTTGQNTPLSQFSNTNQADEIIPELSFDNPFEIPDITVIDSQPVPETAHQQVQNNSFIPLQDSFETVQPQSTADRPKSTEPAHSNPFMPSITPFKNFSRKAPDPIALGKLPKIPVIPNFKLAPAVKPVGMTDPVWNTQKTGGSAEIISEIDEQGEN